jgi:hypothetical protein
MRFEAKHNYFKKLSQKLGNFINIAWTLASRHQEWHCYQWHGTSILGHETEIGPGDSVAQLDRPELLHDAEDCFR